LVAVYFSSAVVSDELVELSIAWIISAGFVCFVGGIDDRYDLPSRVKLILQIVSVLPIVCFGYYVDRVVAFGYPIELGWLGIPLTVIWLVGCINALNLIDGMDGLASLVGLSAAVMMGMIAASEGHPHVAVIATVLAASLLGFLVYNLPPASVFLGDTGSMVIGLSLGLLGIQGALKTTATLAITAPAVVMTLPMFDILAAVVRRKLTGRRFDSPDRLHIHHRLLDRGWTPWQVLCLIGAVCLTTGAAATAATILRRDVLAWVTAMMLIGVLIRLRLFGYEEFALLKEAVVRSMRSMSTVLVRLGAETQPFDDGEDFKADAMNFEGPSPSLPLWEVFLQNARVWDIGRVEFSALRQSQIRRIQWIDPITPTTGKYGWSLSVSLPDVSGEICEIRASRLRPVANAKEYAAMTAMLKTFGAYFASNVDRIFGPLPDDAMIESERSPQRKAA
jgi:UDP-N-acetylmuramyl pentapeptide phosphotransferase/UDP-N-acetylglucosamine-1-phosphate transferase